MLMSENTRQKLIDLVTKSFQMNSFCDNVAYNIEYANYTNIADVFHHSFAHKFPEFADIITGLMAQLDARAVRNQLEANDDYYDGNLAAMFADVESACEEYRTEIVSVIDVADLNGDGEVRIAMEELLHSFMPYYKQARTWALYAKKYEGDEKTFDIHFGNFTKYITVVK